MITSNNSNKNLLVLIYAYVMLYSRNCPRRKYSDNYCYRKLLRRVSKTYSSTAIPQNRPVEYVPCTMENVRSQSLGGSRKHSDRGMVAPDTYVVVSLDKAESQCTEVSTRLSRWVRVYRDQYTVRYTLHVRVDVCTCTELSACVPKWVHVHLYEYMCTEMSTHIT